MYNKRAFVHWYVNEGMEEREMKEAEYEMDDISIGYKELAREYNDSSD